MRAGRLRQRITLQTVARTQDSGGQWVSGSPVTLRTIWARGRKMGGTEAFHAGQTIADAEWRFTCRGLDVSDVAAGVVGETVYRVSYDGKAFDILDVRDVNELGNEVELTCSER